MPRRMVGVDNCETKERFEMLDKSKGDSSRAPERTELTTRTRSKKSGGIHGKGATKANKIRRDLWKTERRKSGKNGSRRALKRVVDWNEFHDLLLETFESCNHDHAQCRRILTGMGLADEAIDAALLDLEEQGGYCDCEVLLNVSMTYE
jgi:Protein of unknown function (DUF2695)